MAERLSWKFASPMKYPNGSSLSLPSLDALKVDVLVASLIGAAQHATTTIPIVFIASDPVGSKLVNSLARPGGNATGVTGQAPVTVQGSVAPHDPRCAAGQSRLVAKHRLISNCGERPRFKHSFHPVKVSTRGEFEGAFDRVAEA